MGISRGKVVRVDGAVSGKDRGVRCAMVMTVEGDEERGKQ